MDPSKIIVGELQAIGGPGELPQTQGKYRFKVRRIFLSTETHEKKPLTQFDFSISVNPGAALDTSIFKESIPARGSIGADYFRHCFSRWSGDARSWIWGFCVPTAPDVRDALGNLLIDPRDRSFSLGISMGPLLEKVPDNRMERWSLAADLVENHGHLRFAEMLRNWLKIGAGNE